MIEMKQVPFEDRSKPKEVPAPVEQVKKEPKNKVVSKGRKPSESNRPWSKV